MLVRTMVSLLAMLAFASSTFADENIDPAAGAFVRENVLKRLARRMEPDLKGEPGRLKQYVTFLQSEIGNDKRLFAFYVEPESLGDNRVRLTGYVEFPEMRDAVSGYLKTLGFEVDNQVEVLPSAGLGEKKFGIMKASQSFSFDRPAGRRISESECLLGEPLYLLREEDGYLLVHSGEGYLGYVRAHDVRRVDDAAFAEYMNGPRVRVLEDYSTADGKFIPAEARLKFSNSGSDAVTVELPTGEKVQVPASKCEVLRDPVATLETIASRARQLVGTKYKWGGRTSKGVDCSGLVQLSYTAAGLQLPRDSYQQVYAGRLSATRWHRADLRAGDTMYFLAPDGKIRHTALYLGNDRFVQAVVPVVKISSLNPAHQEYDEGHDKSFAFAKRLVE